jgi:phosphohistidine swiveling domain-containing protein
MNKERRFPLPFELETPPGAEGWEEMYPYHYVFTKEHPEIDTLGEGQRGFWYQDAIHLPHAMYPIEAHESIHWRYLIGQQNNRMLCVPPAAGVPQRIFHGYLYNSSVNITDPEAIANRAEMFPKRIGYYFKDWEELIRDWKKQTIAVLREGEKIHFPDISQIKIVDESYLEKGYGPADEIYTSFLKLIEYHHQVYIKHFELQSIGYMGYMGFHELCKKIFPKITDYRITTMLQGFDADSYRGDRELKKLARAALELGVQHVIKENRSAEKVFTEMEKSDAGQEWLKRWKEAEDPWLMNTGGCGGLLWFDKLWRHNWDLPIGFIRNYVEALERGESIDKDTKKVAEESDRIAAEYAKLLQGDTRKQFEGQRKFGQTCLYFAEDHQFFAHGWALINYHDKLRDLGKIFTAFDIFEDPEDIRFFKQTEIMETMMDVLVTWANYHEKHKSKSAYILPEKIRQRKKIWEALNAWHPPRALGYPPTEVKEPYSAMLWGMTPEKIDRWLNELEGKVEDEKDTAEKITGMPGSAGIVEGKARVLMSIYEAAEIEDNEILVTSTTTPDWGPVFVKLKGIVTDSGGVMSHAAIVAREYGLACVVGTANATKAIKTGDLIRVDGEKGIVEILQN